MNRFAVATLLATATTAAAAAAPPAPAPPSRDSSPTASPTTTAPVAPPASAAERPLAPPSAVEPQKPKEEYVPNAVLLVAAGGALGAGGLLAGGYLGYKLECASGCGGEFGGLGGLLLGAGIGLTVGSTTGIMLTGLDGEHHSSAGLTWLGTAIGGALGGLAAGKLSRDLPSATFLLATGSALGGTLMYYAARTKDRTERSPGRQAGGAVCGEQRSERRSTNSVRPAPVVRVVPFTDGSSVGVALVGNGL